MKEKSEQQNQNIQNAQHVILSSGVERTSLATSPQVFIRLFFNSPPDTLDSGGFQSLVKRLS
jgi:hypothetical protein